MYGTKLIEDKWRRDAILDAIRNGLTQEMAADLACVHRDTLNNWIKRGKEQMELPDDKKDIYFDFFLQIKKERAKLVQELTGGIREKAKDQWQAGAWFLERRFHKEFGKTLKVEGDASSAVNYNIYADDKNSKMSYKDFMNLKLENKKESEDEI